MNLSNYVKSIYGEHVPMAPCPFTEEEIAELDKTNELLIYVPSQMSMGAMCEMLNIKPNVNFTNEGRMIRNVMVEEAHWYITSASKTPELMNKSGKAAKREFEDEGLHAMDMRRYLAFCAAFKQRFGELPDQQYWCFLLSGSYDRSGVSVVGFDAQGTLSHHGWMHNFQSKFTGSRYAILAPRIEITPETKSLPRAKRGVSGVHGGAEACLDRS